MATCPCRGAAAAAAGRGAGRGRLLWSRLFRAVPIPFPVASFSPPPPGKQRSPMSNEMFTAEQGDVHGSQLQEAEAAIAAR
jgi:hypothetical protein